MARRRKGHWVVPPVPPGQGPISKVYPDRWKIRGWRFGLHPYRPDARKKGMEGEEFIHQMAGELVRSCRLLWLPVRVWWEAQIGGLGLPLNMKFLVLLIDTPEIFGQDDARRFTFHPATVEDRVHEVGSQIFTTYGKEDRWNRIRLLMDSKILPGWDGFMGELPRTGVWWEAAQQCLFDPFSEKPNFMLGPEGEWEKEGE